MSALLVQQQLLDIRGDNNMFLPTLQVTETELMDNLLPHIRRGQWIQLSVTGAKGQYIGWNHRTGTVRVAWLNGRTIKQQNQYMQMASQSFDTQMSETKERAA